MTNSFKMVKEHFYCGNCDKKFVAERSHKYWNAVICPTCKSAGFVVKHNHPLPKIIHKINIKTDLDK